MQNAESLTNYFGRLVVQGQGQGVVVQGQGQGLVVRGQGQGQGHELVNWFSGIPEDKDFP